jgi:integrase
MHQLPNDCRCSDIKITKSKKGKNQIWRIYYYFYDPTFPKPHQVTIKENINRIVDLKERSSAAKQLIENEWKLLKEYSYNPITGTTDKPIDSDYDIHPDTYLIDALKKAMELITVGHRTKIGIKSILKGVETASRQLRLNTTPVSKIARKHIKIILNQCSKNSNRWSNSRYNLYRGYLMSLFNELVELDAVTGNPVTGISKKPVIKKIKEVLTQEQRIRISNHLANVYPRFLSFIHLFFHSGGRKTELFQLKPGNVDLANQKYRCIIRKRKQHLEVERTIKDLAVPYWREFLKDCPDDHFIFGAHYLPAAIAMTIDGPTKHWKKYIKTGLGIDIDFYALKHLHTTEIVDALDEQAAAELNKHTSTAMVVSIYDVKQKDRQHEKLKKVNNPFV